MTFDFRILSDIATNYFSLLVEKFVMNADIIHISFIDKGDSVMRIVLVLVTLMLIIGLAVCPVMAADNSVTINPWGIMNGAYIIDYEHSIKGNGALNGCVAIYSLDNTNQLSASELSGYSLSGSFKQYFNTESQQGKYFGLNGTYYDIAKAKNVWFVEEGQAASFTVDIGYRRIFESGLTIDLGTGAGYIKRQGITDFMLEFKVQTGFGW